MTEQYLDKNVFMSQIEVDMMDLCHEAYAARDLLEKPLTNKEINIGPTSWRSMIITTPDQKYEKAVTLVYFDGHPHYSRVRSRRDNEINTRLTEMGWTVLRFLYRRNTKKLRLIFLQSIIETVNEKIIKKGEMK